MKECFAIGIDLGASQIKCGIVSDRGKIRFKQACPTPANSGRAKIASTLEKATSQLLEFSRRPRIEIKGIGIGSPGTVEPETGRVVGASPNLPGWPGVNLKKIFRKFGLPIFADNDANLMALAESRLGAAKGYQNVVCLTIGTGIGGGLILDGRVYHGSSSAAGELGHTTIALDGKLCRCGNRGCLEAYASVPALLESARKLLKTSDNHSILRRYGDNLTPSHIFAALKVRDPIAQSIIKMEAEYLAAGLASAVNLLNPEVIVVGGGLVEASSSFLRSLEKRIKSKAFPSAARGLKVLRAQLGNEAGFIGAALFCLENIRNN